MSEEQDRQEAERRRLATPEECWRRFDAIWRMQDLSPTALLAVLGMMKFINDFFRWDPNEDAPDDLFEQPYMVAYVAKRTGLSELQVEVGFAELKRPDKDPSPRPFGSTLGVARMSAPERKFECVDGSLKGNASKFLRHVLRHGPHDVRWLHESSNRLDIEKRELREAHQTLMGRDGGSFDGYSQSNLWVWELREGVKACGCPGRRSSSSLETDEERALDLPFGSRQRR